MGQGIEEGQTAPPIPAPMNTAKRKVFIMLDTIADTDGIGQPTLSIHRGKGNHWWLLTQPQEGNTRIMTALTRLEHEHLKLQLV